MNTQTLLLLAAAGGVGFWIFSQRTKQQSDAAATARAMADIAETSAKASRRTKSERAGGVVGDVADWLGFG